MDSLTQIALGAAMGELAMGRRIAAKAALYGAVLATLPDLDVLVPMGDPVADFTYHRSWSHSLLVLAAVSPVIAFAIHRWRNDPPEWLQSWMLLVFLVLITHPLLDAFTVYGTQLLWPVTEYPFGIGSIFIIDPLYTVPLAVGVVIALRSARGTFRRTLANLIGLTCSSFYLAWTVLGQGIETRVAERSLKAEGLNYDKVLTIPSPFNTLLWRTIAISPDGTTYHVGYHSLFDGTDHATFTSYPAGHSFLDKVPGHWPAERLAWFSKGFYRARLERKDLVISDLRMGVEGRYVFSFKVGESQSPTVKPTVPVRIMGLRSLDGLSRIWERIWDARVNVVPRS